MDAGDVAGDHRGVDDLAVGVRDRRDAERDHDPAPVLGHPLRLVVIDGLAGEDAVEDPLLVAGEVLGDQDRDVAADRLLRGPAVDLGRGGVPARDVPVRSLLRIASSEDSTIAAKRSSEAMESCLERAAVPAAASGVPGPCRVECIQCLAP